jgi:hypothetical protein
MMLGLNFLYTFLQGVISFIPGMHDGDAIDASL